MLLGSGCGATGANALHGVFLRGGTGWALSLFACKQLVGSARQEVKIESRWWEMGMQSDDVDPIQTPILKSEGTTSRKEKTTNNR